MRKTEDQRPLRLIVRIAAVSIVAYALSGIAGCSSLARQPENRANQASNTSEIEDNTPVTKMPTPEVEPDFSNVKTPPYFAYKFSAFSRGANGESPMYSYRIDKAGDVVFTSYRRTGRGDPTSLDFKITKEDLKKIYYYFNKIKLGSLATEYLKDEMKPECPNTFRGPYLYEVELESDRGAKKIKFLEFYCSNPPELSDLREFVKRTEQYSYLKPHIRKATTNS
jgi:hypothetical protein